MFTFFKKYFSKIHINSNSNLTNEQYQKIAIGALYSEQQGAFINSLTTGLGKDKLQNLLSNWWGIENHEDAIESLSYLKDKGFRYYFPTVIEAYKSTPDKAEDIIISGFNQTDESYQEDIEKAYSQYIHLNETWEELISNNILENTNDLIKLGNVGWDAGRLVFLTRMCFDAEYLSEQEAWGFIDNAYKLATKSFRSWDEFSKSYIIGRGMWGGENCANQGIMTIAEYLLKNDKSPWVNLNFKN